MTNLVEFIVKHNIASFLRSTRGSFIQGDDVIITTTFLCFTTRLKMQ